ncbi:hypothetical protein [Phenylobacterium sp.]|uniref:hypothetical protein n=1 Tax=Phenylobacterium sp. TaxID=1871053 RepID=UPI002811B858|nr:hypothetical protein [Phenylobacterium sp.]
MGALQADGRNRANDAYDDDAKWAGDVGPPNAPPGAYQLSNGFAQADQAGYAEENQQHPTSDPPIPTNECRISQVLRHVPLRLPGTPHDGGEVLQLC